MAMLIIGLVIFLGLHSTRIFAEDIRAKAIARFGEGPWKAIYSVLSLIGLVLIIWGFAQARLDAATLWSPPVYIRHIAITLMLISLILLGAYMFKKSHIATAVHHPMVWSVAIWSAAHLLANGSVADLVLFGAFLVWAAADLFAAYARDRRKAIVYPAPEWGATIGAIVLGVILWGVLLGGLHLWLFRVSPMAV
ncbi:MAG TPA: NnrU family protein [Roseiarcus sp.]|nr:NnrU family protein [Roseiarcus sp.]